MFGKNKKNKPDKSFEPYLWSFEEVLWQSRPYASFAEYAAQTPAEIDSRSDTTYFLPMYDGNPIISPFIRIISFVLSCFISVSFFMLLLSIISQLPNWGIFTAIFTLLALIALASTMFVFLFIFLFLTYLLGYIAEKFLFRVGEKDSAWYAVTTHRIYWRFRQRDWRYIDYHHLYKVVIRDGSDGDTLEWHGRMPTQVNNPHGSQIPKIVFLGVYGAEDVIAKAQAYCENLIEVVDERQLPKALTSSESIDDVDFSEDAKHQQAKQ